MKNNIAKSKFKSKNVVSSFTGTQLTKYAGLSPIMKYINRLKLGHNLNDLFLTDMYFSTKFTNVQIMLAVILASFSGINRLIKIAAFTGDALVMMLLGLNKKLNKDVISTRLKQLGQSGSIKLQEYLFGLTTQFLSKTQVKSITIDADSTVKTVYGNQQGAKKGFNPQKQGAKSYHPLLAFVSEIKLVVNSWFRSGDCYTSNGICEFVKQTKAILPLTITQVFFRADSGFFNGDLFELLESYHWTYLVKVKLKSLKPLLEKQNWQVLADKPDTAICQFTYKGQHWKKERTFRAIRTVSEWVKTDFMGTIEWVPKYEYACYCSNRVGDVLCLHKLYQQRSTSETWIEQVKSQVLAGATLTDNFHANDMLWQLSVLAYNLSVMMRYNVKKQWQQEHATFRDWFIVLPAKLVKGSRRVTLKIYQNYFYKQQWSEFEQVLLLAD